MCLDVLVELPSLPSLWLDLWAGRRGEVDTVDDAKYRDFKSKLAPVWWIRDFFYFESAIVGDFLRPNGV